MHSFNILTPVTSIHSPIINPTIPSSINILYFAKIQDIKVPVVSRQSFMQSGLFSNKKKVIKFLVDWVLPLIAVVYILNFVLLLGVVVSGSMEPTLMTGSIQLGNRLAYVNHEIERGDVIYFKHGKDIAGKRVIGIAGDKIEFFDGDVYLNGELLQEEYLAFDTDTNCSDTFEVPKGKIFDG